MGLDVWLNNLQKGAVVLKGLHEPENVRLHKTAFFITPSFTFPPAQSRWKSYHVLIMLICVLLCKTTPTAVTGTTETGDTWHRSSKYSNRIHFSIYISSPVCYNPPWSLASACRILMRSIRADIYRPIHYLWWLTRWHSKEETFLTPPLQNRLPILIYLDTFEIVATVYIYD